MTAVSPLHFYTLQKSCFSFCKGRSEDEQVRTNLTSLKLLSAKALERQVGWSQSPFPPRFTERVNH